jgi:hypothetical protein
MLSFIPFFVNVLQELTFQFLLSHSLPPEYFTPLLEFISQTQRVSGLFVCKLLYFIVS